MPPDGGDSNTATVSILVLFGPPEITTKALPGGCTTEPYGPVQLEAIGGQPELSWSASGLPDGLSISPQGELAGTPTELGEFNPRIRVDDSLGRSVDVRLPLRITTICPSNVGDLNCDDRMDAFDIEPFLIAVFEPWNYAPRYPDCDIRRGDINFDGSVNAFDVEPFLVLLFR